VKKVIPGKLPQLALLISLLVFCAGCPIPVDYWFYTDVDSYSPEGDTWRSGPDLTRAYCNGPDRAYTWDGCIYVFFANGIYYDNGDWLPEKYIHKFESDNWSLMPISEPEIREKEFYYFSTVSWDNAVYFFFSERDESKNEINDLWTYDFPSDTWEKVRDLDNCLAILPAARIDEKVYFLKKPYQNGKMVLITYNLESGEIEGVTDVPSQIPAKGTAWYDRESAVAYQEKVYLFPGYKGEFFCYDPMSNTFTELAEEPGHTYQPAVCLYEDKLYLFNSYDRNNTKHTTYGKAYVYDFVSDSWAEINRIPRCRMGATSTVLGNRIYVIGGTRTGGELIWPWD
jgi:hypothetical protein